MHPPAFGSSSKDGLTSNIRKAKVHHLAHFIGSASSLAGELILNDVDVADEVAAGDGAGVVDAAAALRLT